MIMGLFGGYKKLKGRVLHVREVLGTVRIEVEFAKSRATGLFTGAVNYGKLAGKTATLVVEKIDTRSTEVRAMRAERKAKRRLLSEQRNRPA